MLLAALIVLIHVIFVLIGAISAAFFMPFK